MAAKDEAERIASNQQFWRELVEAHRSKPHLRNNNAPLPEQGVTELERKLREKFNQELKR